MLSNSDPLRYFHPTAGYRLGTAAVFFALWACYLWLGIHNPYVGFLADDALYLLMADIYSPWRTFSGAVYTHLKLYSHLPPAFPLLLAWSGGDTQHLLPARIVVATAMAAANFLFFCWLRQQAVSRSHSLLLAVVVGALPCTLIFVVDLWSEGTYLALFWLCLVCANAAVAPRASWTLAAAFGLLVVGAIYTRTIGVALLPVAASWIFRVRPRRAFIAVLSGGLLAALLQRLDMGQATDSYADLLRAHYHDQRFAGLVEQLRSALYTGWRQLPYDLWQWRTLPTLWHFLALVSFLLLAAWGGWHARRKTPELCAYAALYLAIALVWPFSNSLERFLFPLLPLVIYFAYVGARCAGPAFALLFIVIMLGLELPVWRDTALALSTPPAPPYADFRTTRYWLDLSRRDTAVTQISGLAALYSAVSNISREIPPDACVHIAYPQIALLRAKRVAWPLPEPGTITGASPWPCAYLYAVAAASGDKPPFYPLALTASRARQINVNRTRDPDGSERIVGVLLYDTHADPKSAPVQ